MILFGLVASSIWVLAHVYVGRRLITESEPSRGVGLGLWGLVALHGSIAPIASLWRRAQPEGAWFETLQFVAYVGMGFFVLLFLMVLARDAVRLIRWGFVKVYSVASSDEPADMSRRGFLTSVVNAGFVGSAAASTAYGYHEARRDPDVTEVELPVPGLPKELDGFRIAQVSDLHIGPTIRGDFLKRVVTRVNTLNADMVAVTGDFIDGFVEDLREETAHLGDLESRYGTYYCLGNHEYYWDAPGWCAEVERLGATVLVDDHAMIVHKGRKVLVGGVADYSAGRRFNIPGHDSSPLKAMQGAPEHDFSLLLAHQPKSIWEAAEAGFDLQMSGHTHGGQFWPWNYLVGLAHPFSAGLDEYEGTAIYVNRGTGYWGPPLRLGVPSEITLLTLRSAPSAVE